MLADPSVVQPTNCMVMIQSTHTERCMISKFTSSVNTSSTKDFTRKFSDVYFFSKKKKLEQNQFIRKHPNLA